MHKVILLEKDDKILSDIKCSLDLIGVSVIHVNDLNACKEALVETDTPLILARIGKQIEDQSKIKKTIEASGTLFGVPVAALGTETELLAARNEGLKPFAELKLPVEFPQFTYDVQRVLAEALGTVQESTSSDVSSDTDLADETAVSSEKIVNTKVLNMKYSLLFKLQTQVMMGLIDSGIIEEQEIDNLPRILSEETRSACEKFAIRGIGILDT
ncbi:MAG: hypothetical protein R3A13_01010 [Bdellovibrionota bacterium]